MKEIVQFIWPDLITDILYIMEHQAPGENPVAYEAYKKLLATFTDKVTNAQGTYDYEDVEFKGILNAGFSLQIKITIGPLDPTTPVLARNIRKKSAKSLIFLWKQNPLKTPLKLLGI